MAEEQTFRRAVTWAYIMNWGDKGFSVLFTFVLAAVLGPRDFGIVAIAMIYILFIRMFLEQGLAAAVIQRKELTREHLDSVFWMNMVLSLLLVGISIAFSRWWAALNHLPTLGPVISALSLSIPIEGLTIVQRSILQREMDFKSLSLRTNISALVGGIIGLGMAFTGFGVWALVGQLLGRDIVSLCALWKLSSWRPRPRLSFRSLAQLLHFSSSTFIAQLGVFANTQADALMLGAFFGPTAVGLYRLAERVSASVLTASTSSLQSVSLPQFSRFQDDSLGLRRNMFSFLRLCSIVTVPAMAGIAVTSRPLMAVLGKTWGPAGDVLPILCVFGVIVAFAQFTGPLLQALSKPHYVAMFVWAQAIASAAVLMASAFLLRNAALGTQVVGVATSRLVTSVLVSGPILFYVLRRFGGIRARDFLAAVTPSLFAAGAIIASVSSLSMVLKAVVLTRPLTLLMAEIVVGTIAGVGTLLFVDGQLRARAADLYGKVSRRKPVAPSGGEVAAGERMNATADADHHCTSAIKPSSEELRTVEEGE